MDDCFPETTFSAKPNRETLYGICFTPPKCEKVDLIFLSNSKLCAIQNLELNKDLENLEDDVYLYYLSVKTLYCGAEIHKLLITIFDYLNKKYFEDFEFTDEGQYWETRDETLLKATFDRYANLINRLESVVEHIHILEYETLEGYILRMTAIVKNKNK